MGLRESFSDVMGLIAEVAYTIDGGPIEEHLRRANEGEIFIFDTDQYDSGHYEHLGVDHPRVAKVRAELQGQMLADALYVEEHSGGGFLNASRTMLHQQDALSMFAVKTLRDGKMPSDVYSLFDDVPVVEDIAVGQVLSNVLMDASYGILQWSEADLIERLEHDLDHLLRGIRVERDNDGNVLSCKYVGDAVDLSFEIELACISLRARGIEPNLRPDRDEVQGFSEGPLNGGITQG